MDTTTKIKLLFYGFIFLAMINLGMIGTIFFHISQDKKNQSSQQSTLITDTSSAPAPRPYYGRRIRFRYIVKSLDLTQEQYQQFLQIHRKYIKQMRAYTKQLRAYRQDIDRELGKATPDTNQIRQWADEIGNLHKQITLLQVRYYLSLAQVCTPQQRRKLYQIYRRTQAKPPWKYQSK